MVREPSGPDNFLEGLSLGVWDEELGYWRPLHILGLIETFTEEEMMQEITDIEDMKKGEW